LYLFKIHLTVFFLSLLRRSSKQSACFISRSNSSPICYLFLFCLFTDIVSSSNDIVKYQCLVSNGNVCD
jgi:hypothetical protein